MGVEQSPQRSAQTGSVLVGAVRIARLVGELVVLAVVGYPLNQRTLDRR